jgi:hypothetical protein
MKLTFTIPEKISLNKIYAGVHFRERMSHKDAYYYAVLEARLLQYEGPYPIHIHYYFKLRGAPLDIDNHVYVSKMVADSLVAAQVIPGDEQEYIGAVTITAEKVGKGARDEVLVEFAPASPQGGRAQRYTQRQRETNRRSSGMKNAVKRLD